MKSWNGVDMQSYKWGWSSIPQKEFNMSKMDKPRNGALNTLFSDMEVSIRTRTGPWPVRNWAAWQAEPAKLHLYLQPLRISCLILSSLLPGQQQH